MHTVTLEREIQGLPAGKWLMEDLDVAQVIRMAGGGECQIEPWKIPINLGTLTIVRPGRFGDLIMLTPCLRELKRLQPDTPLQVAAASNYRDALIGCPYIDGFVNYPISLPVEGGMISLEVSPAYADKERSMHMTDLFAERLGLTGDFDKKPDYFMSPAEHQWADEAYPCAKGAKRVAIQCQSSTPSRDYPQARLAEVIVRLYQRGWDIVMLGAPGQINAKSKPRMTNCSNDKLTFRQSAAVLATADVFLGPDSSLIHVAGALGIPAVGLFSTVPWELRTKYCPTTFVIQGKKGCDIAPCFHAPRNGQGFPSDGPCMKVRKCCALDGIDPKQVVAKVEALA